MLAYLLVCLSVGFVSGSTYPEDVEVGAIPYQVSLRLHDVVYNTNDHFCSGAILDPKWVVTAARCLTDVRSHRIRVVAGTITLDSKGSWYEVESTIVHENFQRDVKSDVGLLKIKNQIEFNDKISAINLPKSNTPDGSICVVSGWHYVNSKGGYSSKLQAVNVTTLSTKQCRETKLKQHEIITTITDQQVCTFKDDGRAVCMSDSGSPLAKDNELVGFATFDSYCAKGYPNVYLRVYEFKNWITSHMN